MSTLYYESSISHHGIKGQKWGIRRFQNKDGTLTPRGQKRYQKEMERITRDQNIERRRIAMEQAKVREARKTEQAKLKLQAEKEGLANDKQANRGKVPATESKNSRKPISEMSNEEIIAAINRVKLEQQLRDLTTPPPKQMNPLVKEFGTKAVSSISTELVKAIGGLITADRDREKAARDAEKVKREWAREDAKWQRDRDRDDAKWQRELDRDDAKWQRELDKSDREWRRDRSAELADRQFFLNHPELKNQKKKKQQQNN